MKLTTANVALSGGKRDAVFFDDELTGFGLRVRIGSGDRVLKSWLVQKRARGKMKRYLIGDAAVIPVGRARAEAKKLLAEIALGGDPQGEKRDRRERDAHTLRSVVADYLDQKGGSVKPVTLRILRRYLASPLYLKPLHGVPIDQINRKDISTRLLAVSKDSGAQTAIGVRSSLSALFVWAMTMGLCESSPMIAAFKPPKQRTRERVLSDQELAAIWNALADDEFGSIVKLLMLTGCRRQEIAGMQWGEFNGDLTEWTLPKERSKTGKARTLPVTPMMREIIDSVPRRVGHDFLFGIKHGFSHWACKQELEGRLDLPEWRLHDIRRTFSTRANDLGIASPHVIEKILGHTLGGSHGVYNRATYAAEVRSAMLRWSTHIAEIVEGGPRKIVAFERVAVASTHDLPGAVIQKGAVT